MRNSTSKINSRAVSGFTLIELMVVLGIISIIAAASVPKIQDWTARNRAKAFIAGIISDYTKTKSVAGSSDRDTGSFIGARVQTAMVFEEDSYYVLQRDSMAVGGWSKTNDTVLKSVGLNSSLELLEINGNDVSSSQAIVFSSTGRLKDNSNNLIALGVGGNLPCGPTASPLNGKRVLVVEFKARVNDSGSFFYRIEFDSIGEYFVCSATNSAFSENVNVYEI